MNNQNTLLSTQNQAFTSTSSQKQFDPKPFGKRNGCYVCGGQTPNCRYNSYDPDFVMCFTYANARLGEIINGFVCVAEAKGHTASFKLHNAQYSQEKRLERQQQTRADRRARDRLHQQFLQNLLPAPERDALYRNISSHLFLSGCHEASLDKKRHLRQDEILFAYENAWLRSWQPGLEISSSPNLSKLPGINPTTNTLTGVPGIAIAATDHNGHICGYQIASDNRDKYGKYLWLSSKNQGGNPPHLPNGNSSELPLFVWRHPHTDHVSETWVTEGGLKSLIVALKLWFRLGRRDIQVIGASGGNFCGSSQALKSALADQTTKVVKLCPDAGAIFNERVLRQYEMFLDFVHNQGFEPEVAWWGQFDKANPDIDELREDDLRQLYFMDTVEFLSLNESPPPPPQSVIQSRLNSEDQSWLAFRQFTPDVVVNLRDFDFADIPDSNLILAINSAMGTAKSKFMIKLIKEYEKRNKSAVLLSYRNNLLLQTGDRALREDVAIYHIHYDENARIMLGDDSAHHMMCIDSIHYVEGYFKGKDVYLDETCLILLHAITGGTLGDKQAKVLRIFTQALNECDRIILLDANLSDFLVDFIAKLAPSKRVLKIKNQYKLPPHNITFIDGVDPEGEIKKGDKSPLIQYLLRPGVKPWIFCDSKELTKVLYKLLTAAGKTGYVLNSDTTGEPWAKKFLHNQDTFILEYKPDFNVLSPSGDSGLSCTLNNYFTDKFSFFTGVLRTNAQHQSMFRLRDHTLPHYVFCPEHSDFRPQSTPATYAAESFKRIVEEQIALSAKIATLSADSPQDARRRIAEAILSQNDHWWDFSHQLAVLDNFEIDNYRDCLIHALLEAGHNVSIDQWETAAAAREKEKQAQEAVMRQHAAEMHAAEEFSNIEDANRRAKSNPDAKTLRRVEKTKLLHRLPGIQNSPVWSPDFIYYCHLKNKDFISQQERYWLLSNYDVSQKRHESIWFHAATSGDFFGRRYYSLGHDAIWALNELRLLEFTQSETGYHKDSPELVTLVETLRAREDLRTALRMNQLEARTPNGKERLRILSQLLKIIGFKTEAPKRKRVKTPKGVRNVRVYSVVPFVHRVHVDTPPPIYIDKPGSVYAKTDQFGKPATCLPPDYVDILPPNYIYKPGYDYVKTAQSGKPVTCLPLDYVDILRPIYIDKPRYVYVETDQSGKPATCLPPDYVDTPLSIYIDKPGCDYVETAQNDVSATEGTEIKAQFDFLAARQAILEAVNQKLTNWMSSPKSEITWVVEGEAENQQQKFSEQKPADQKSAEVTAGVLRQLRSWDETFVFSQEQINEAWELLTPDEQSRLRNLSQSWEQQQQQQKLETSLEILRSCQSWEQISLSQEDIDAVWGLLSADEQSRLQNLYFFWQQQQQSHAPQDQQPSDQKSLSEVDLLDQEVWVYHYGQWIRSIVRAWEDRPDIKFFKAVVEFIGGGTSTVWSREAITFGVS